MELCKIFNDNNIVDNASRDWFALVPIPKAGYCYVGIEATGNLHNVDVIGGKHVKSWIPKWVVNHDSE